MGHFSEQPNEMLDMLLNTPIIPLPQRMRLRAVSRRWVPVLEDGLARETTLVIRDKASLFLKSQANDLVLEGGILTEEIIRTLVRLFPLAAQLSIVFGNASVSWSTVPSLLAQIGTNLTSVKLEGYIDQAVAEPLASAPAHLPALTSFTLTDFNRRLLPHLGPVLSRLETFVYPIAGNSPESAALISSSLSPRCTRLLLGPQVFASLPAPFRSQLSTNLMHLSLVSCGATIWEPLLQMHGLTSLALGIVQELMAMEWNHFDMFVFENLFRHLAPFTRLTDLKLFNLSYDDRFTIDMPSKKETTLSTIKRLTLEVFFGNEDFSDDEEDSQDDHHCPMDYQDASIDNEDFSDDEEDSSVDKADSPVDEPDSLNDFQTLLKCIAAWFPALTQLTLITEEEAFEAFQECQDQLPFPMELVAGRPFENMHLDL